MKHFKFRKRTDDAADVDMTPMLDIVFIMLIFFIVTAVFLDETGLDFTTPGESSQTPSRTDTIQIYVNAKDQISVDSVPVTLKGVSARVERRLADKPGANILLLASEQATVDPVVSIKDQMALAGRKTVVKVSKD